MGYYDIQAVCLNGHQITDRLGTALRQTAYCSECGAKGISECPSCKHPIRGYYHADGVIDLSSHRTSIPKNCENCGAPYPWREQLEQREARKGSSTPLQQVERLLKRFHIIVRQLRARHEGRETISVKDEYDVQDLLHALLKVDFDDVRPEEWTPSYAGKSSRMDFLLKAENIVIETKMTRKGVADKEIGDQLIVDVARYKEHPGCKTLVCFVYDPDGYIRNASGLKTDLESRQKSLKVVVVITP